jgi:hypothetical protein
MRHNTPNMSRPKRWANLALSHAAVYLTLSYLSCKTIYTSNLFVGPSVHTPRLFVLKKIKIELHSMRGVQYIWISFQTCHIISVA